MSIPRYTKTAPWPSAPGIRGRDLTWIVGLGAAGLAILFGLTSLLLSLDRGPATPASAPEFDIWPNQGSEAFWALNIMIGVFYAYLALLVYAVLVRTRRQSWRDLGFRPFDARWLAAAAALGGILFVSGEWMTGLLELKDQAEAYNRSLFVPENAGKLTAAVAMLLIGPATAVIEELGFRGLLHRWIRQRFGRLFGVSLGAAVFAVVHLGFLDPGGVLGWYWTGEVFLFGVVLALLFEWSGSLWPPILLHAANNVAAVALAYLSA